MTTMQRDPLVDDYLRRLEAAAADLPRARRVELVSEIDEHIEAALGEDGGRGKAAVLNVLERLGTPEEIAAEATAGTPAPVHGQLETAAIVVLVASIVLPFVGYLIGAGLVLASRAWNAREKAIALLIPPLVLTAAGLLLLRDVAGVVEIVLIATALSGPIGAAYLARRLRRPKAA